LSVANKLFEDNSIDNLISSAAFFLTLSILVEKLIANAGQV